MTIIVVDSVERIMASDTLVTDGDLKSYTAKKIWRCKDGSLAGASGDNEGCMKFLAWAKDGCKGKVKFKETRGVILTPKGEIRFFDGTPGYDVVRGAFFAIGSGADVAMGAYHAGAAAAQCVEAAIALNISCGGQVIIEKL
jgi:ATP-dependent protease HslVU (ClpYQ) peptidase subunit